LKLKFFTEAGHFSSKVCNLLIFLFDAFMRAEGMPDFGLITSFIVLQTRGAGGHREGRYHR
jgi:hypothetical protein